MVIISWKSIIISRISPSSASPTLIPLITIYTSIGTRQLRKESGEHHSTPRIVVLALVTMQWTKAPHDNYHPIKRD
jgi:hypothetical protein